MEFKQDLSNVYPSLNEPSAPLDPVGGASAYRLQKINDVQRILEEERDKRETLSKKYHRSVKIIDGIDTVLVTVTMGLGVAGVGLLTTVIAAPAVLGMEVATLVTGLLSIAGKYSSRKLTLKAEKHEKVKVLAEAKLNTISDHISKALTDGIVSDEEFTLILSELNKFREMKGTFRANTKVALDEETRQSLIQQGREEARQSFRRLFDGRSEKKD